MLKAVIFDLDGVIVDSEPVHIKAEKQILLRHGIKATSEELQEYTGATAEFEFSDLTKKHRINATVEELFNENEKILFKLFEKNAPPTKGVIELITGLKQRGVKLGLASSAHKRLIMSVLEKLKINGMFDSILGAEDVTRSKPNAEIFLKSARKLRANPIDCVVIEDSKLGVEAAKNAGMKCVGYRNPHSGNQDLSKADIVIDDFSKSSVRRLLSL